MIEIDGVQPDLKGDRCEELLCQQYRYQGRLEDEADIVLLKIAGVWHQLYFDGGVVHWRKQDESPEPRQTEDDAVFSYPLVDLGSKFGIKDQVIVDCLVRETTVGEEVALLFEHGVTVTFINRGDSTSILYQD